MSLEDIDNFSTALSDGRFCRKRSLLLAMLLQPFKLMIHAIFHAYRCRRREVCKWWGLSQEAPIKLGYNIEF